MGDLTSSSLRGGANGKLSMSGAHHGDGNNHLSPISSNGTNNTSSNANNTGGGAIANGLSSTVPLVTSLPLPPATSVTYEFSLAPVSGTLAPGWHLTAVQRGLATAVPLAAVVARRRIPRPRPLRPRFGFTDKTEARRAKWTIVITALSLLAMSMLLVGITLRLAPLIDDLVRKENEELIRRNVIQQTQFSQNGNLSNISSTPSSSTSDVNNNNNNNFNNTQQAQSGGGDYSSIASSSSIYTASASSIVASDLFLDVNNQNSAKNKNYRNTSSYVYSSSNSKNNIGGNPLFSSFSPTYSTTTTPTETQKTPTTSNPSSTSHVVTTIAPNPSLVTNTNSTNNNTRNNTRNKKNHSLTRLTTSISEHTSPSTGKKLAAIVAIPQPPPPPETSTEEDKVQTQENTQQQNYHHFDSSKFQSQELREIRRNSEKLMSR